MGPAEKRRIAPRCREEGYEVLLTTDKNLRYQQNLKECRIAVVVIGHAQWPALQAHVQRVVEAVDAAAAGSYAEVCHAFRSGTEGGGQNPPLAAGNSARRTLVPSNAMPGGAV